ncbi:response regulator [Desulforhopalus sp. IMCC35007]|uniref:response regulator n=1 Tax=Desulforhopalus sp. IMCC35007 TaxID=2569543 RepID=UPI00145ED4E1|nr:response regulator [Desulforhopalus sp. IMCC35007]
MLTKEKILLIDGDEGVRKSLSLFFGARNYHLHTVENAMQALISIQKQAYDIILCDEVLPDMDGLDFFKIINNRCQETIKILISFYGNNTTLEEVRKRGVDWLLTKPFSGDEVEAALLVLIKSKQGKNSRSPKEKC